MVCGKALSPAYMLKTKPWNWGQRNATHPEQKVGQMIPLRLNLKTQRNQAGCYVNQWLCERPKCTNTWFFRFVCVGKRRSKEKKFDWHNSDQTFLSIPLTCKQENLSEGDVTTNALQGVHISTECEAGISATQERGYWIPVRMMHEEVAVFEDQFKPEAGFTQRVYWAIDWWW